MTAIKQEPGKAGHDGYVTGWREYLERTDIDRQNAEVLMTEAH
jgi:hypothetical protein